MMRWEISEFHKMAGLLFGAGITFAYLRLHIIAYMNPSNMVRVWTNTIGEAPFELVIFSCIFIYIIWVFWRTRKSVIK